MVRFGILGPMQVLSGDGVHVPRGPKVSKVLALLLVRANQLVDVDSLVDELWDGEPPRCAITTVRTHVYHLRRYYLHRLQADRLGDSDLLVTQPSGYLLRLRPEQLDSAVFLQLLAHGQSLLDEGRYAEAAQKCRQALGMWRGRALAGVTPGRLLTQHVTHLEESRIRALELRVEVDMRLGAHRGLVAELRGLVASHPLNEWFHARLIEVLHRSGRRGDALRAFHDVRTLLDEELGLEPSPELQRLQYEILTAHEVRRGDFRAAS